MATIVADVFGAVVRRAETDDAAGMGAAICAAVGSGMYPSWDEAIVKMVRYAPPVQPSPNRTVAYARLHRVHTELRSRTDSLFEWMTAELQP